MALRYHPLFLVTPAWFLGAVHYDCFFKKKKFVRWLLLMVAAALAVIHVLRLLGILASPI